MRFPIGGERVRCHGSKLTNSVRRKNSLTPKGTNNLNFRLARDQVVHLESADLGETKLTVSLRASYSINNGGMKMVAM